MSRKSEGDTRFVEQVSATHEMGLFSSDVRVNKTDNSQHDSRQWHDNSQHDSRQWHDNSQHDNRRIDNSQHDNRRIHNTNINVICSDKPEAIAAAMHGVAQITAMQSAKAAIQDMSFEQKVQAMKQRGERIKKLDRLLG